MIDIHLLWCINGRDIIVDEDNIRVGFSETPGNT